MSSSAAECSEVPRLHPSRIVPNEPRLDGTMSDRWPSQILVARLPQMELLRWMQVVHRPRGQAQLDCLETPIQSAEWVAMALSGTSTTPGRKTRRQRQWIASEYLQRCPFSLFHQALGCHGACKAEQGRGVV